MEIENEIEKEIRRDGYYLALHEAEDDFPAYAYTIGLQQSNGHPELLIFGLDDDTMRILLGDAADRVKAGQPIQPQQHYDDYFEGYKIVFAHVNVDEYKGLFQYGVDFNHGIDFPMLQLIWPDQEHRFPWEEQFDKNLVAKQPLLSA